MQDNPALARLLPEACGLLLCGHTPPPAVLNHLVRVCCAAATASHTCHTGSHPRPACYLAAGAARCGRGVCQRRVLAPDGRRHSAAARRAGGAAEKASRLHAMATALLACLCLGPCMRPASHSPGAILFLSPAPAANHMTTSTTIQRLTSAPMTSTSTTRQRRWPRRCLACSEARWAAPSRSAAAGGRACAPGVPLSSS